MRGILLLTPALLGLLGGAAARLVEESAPSPGDDAVEWDLGPLDARVFAVTPDIDTLLVLDAPSRFASTEAWIEFGRSLKALDTGERLANQSTYTPVLVWWVYVAKHHPDAIYALHDEHVIDDDQLAHLLEFGFAPDWAERLENADRLILCEREALVNLAVARGIDFARRRFIGAFFAEDVPKVPTQQWARFSINLEGLRFALPAMSEAEIEQVIPRLRSGVFYLDPRGIRRLMLDERFGDEPSQLLSLILEHPYSSDMSSYFLDGALLGHGDYVRELIEDAADAAKRPTNFCAACGGLALVGDGLLGSALFEGIESGRKVEITRNGSEFVLSPRPGSAQ